MEELNDKLTNTTIECFIREDDDTFMTIVKSALEITTAVNKSIFDDIIDEMITAFYSRNVDGDEYSTDNQIYAEIYDSIDDYFTENYIYECEYADVQAYYEENSVSKKETN